MCTTIYDYMSKSKCPPKTPCDKDKICNPPTGRCVLKTGAIGKSLEGNKNNAIDPVTMNAIPPHRRVLVDNPGARGNGATTAYDVHSLADIVHRAGQRDPNFGVRPARLPHTMREVTPQEADRWTAHAKKTGWKPDVPRNNAIPNANRRVPEHLRANAAAAELARRQQLERQQLERQQRAPAVPAVSNSNRRFLEGLRAEAPQGPWTNENHRRERTLRQIGRARLLNYPNNLMSTDNHVLVDTFVKAFPLWNVFDFIHQIAFFDFHFFGRTRPPPSWAGGTISNAWLDRIVVNLYEYYKHHSPRQGPRPPAYNKMYEIKRDTEFIDTHQALLSRLSQYFDPLRRQIQTMPVISKDALNELINDFAARHPVFTLPRAAAERRVVALPNSFYGIDSNESDYNEDYATTWTP